MRSFQLIHGFWGLSPTSARDQAVLFRRLDQNLPKRHRTYARRLLLDHRHATSGGASRAARRTGSRVLFKGGWGYGSEATHQGARLERGSTTLGLGITTFGNSGTEYGADDDRARHQGAAASAALRLLSQRATAGRPPRSRWGHPYAGGGAKPSPWR